jgi:hypothetical protein
MNVIESFQKLDSEGKVEHFAYEMGMTQLSEEACAIIQHKTGQTPYPDLEDGYFILKINGKIYYEGTRKVPGVTSDLSLPDFLNQFFTNQTKVNGTQNH